jgi:hypothetical protein
LQPEKRPAIRHSLRSHERDFDIRLHDVSNSSNALVRRFGRRELILSQATGLLTWHGHDGDVALPGMVVDKSVFDRPQNSSWSRWRVCLRVAGDVVAAVEECVLGALTSLTLLNKRIPFFLRTSPQLTLVRPWFAQSTAQYRSLCNLGDLLAGRLRWAGCANFRWACERYLRRSG